MIQKALEILEVGNVPYWHPTDVSNDCRNIGLFLQKYPNATVIYNVRDPRDLLISYYEKFRVESEKLEKRGIPENELVFSSANFPEWKQLNETQQLLVSIINDYRCPLKIGRTVLGGYRAYTYIKHLPQVHLFRYEDLVGPKGGGDIDTQLREVTRLCQVSGGNPKKIPDVMRSLYGNSGSFDKGKVARWKTKLNGAHIRALKATEWNEWIQYFGYEQSPHWREE